MRLVLAICLLWTLAPAVSADPGGSGLGAPERRRDQFPKEYGYAIFPYPYSLPGIGSGLSLVAGALNIGDSYTDAYAIAFTGDVKGGAVGLGDLHLIPRTLILDVGYSSLSRAAFQSYSQRGMNTGKNDFSIAEVTDSDYFGGRLTATFLDRRFELYTAWFESAARLKSIRDNQGNLILEAQDPPRDRGHTTIFGTRFDLTDDYTDPRRGLRADVTHTQSPPKGSGPDFYVMDYSVTAYIPVARWNTVAINLLRSDAFVTRQGETDPAALQAQLGLDCASIPDPAQRQTCNEVITTTAAANQFGTATQLGGFSRLRSYPQGRFKGAHTLFLGAEYRWNLTDEATPFDIFVMKGVRTSIQLAFFYETGVTSDSRDDLYRRSEWRDSYGAGFRIVTGSGVVFRADVAHGKEGFNAAIFIGYPWELQ
ncbi:MAG TPA: BamA/TamA family outer membrane protein [Burkholderiales bacterium]|nr:BamA/TamA family outer membrane protein [Burkholderiales bacterium]